jgi:hypothetical protein
MSLKAVRLVLISLILPHLAVSSDKPKPSALVRTESSIQISYVGGSSQKVCQLIGEDDREFGVPTLSQTETRFGFSGSDNGYSFEHRGRLYFLFGDSHPTVNFNGHPNAQTDAPRVADDNDAIAYVTDSAAGPCLKLNFTTDSIGAFGNPVVLDSKGQPAITLRTNETPVSGISDGGRMYVIFGTDNFLSNPPGGPSASNGGSTRTVVAVSDDSARTFHYLYNFSTAPAAKFIFAAIAAGQDGYIYFWGAQGDTMYRKSPPFLARKPVGGMGDSTAIEYLHAYNPNGTPVFVPGEQNAIPIFHDSLPGPGGKMQLADDVGEIGVEWNRYVRSWVMLYNSSNNSPANPHGVYMRYSPQPWGPWSPPQTIFNPGRDNGFCYFIHRAVTPANPACDSLSIAARLGDGGGNYSPYFISRFTSGDSVQKSSTFFFVMSTWNPYEVVIMKASIQAVTSDVPRPDPQTPYRFDLEQNYPNPFNPSTVVSYQLPVAGDVKLAVYDLLGREVMTLVSGRELAGAHTVRFSSSEGGTKGLASGTYVVRLQAGSYVAVRKMLLIK